MTETDRTLSLLQEISDQFTAHATLLGRLADELAVQQTLRCPPQNAPRQDLETNELASLSGADPARTDVGVAGYSSFDGSDGNNTCIRADAVVPDYDSTLVIGQENSNVVESSSTLVGAETSSLHSNPP
jgi:hypothetical protein